MIDEGHKDVDPDDMEVLYRINSTSTPLSKLKIGVIHIFRVRIKEIYNYPGEASSPIYVEVPSEGNFFL